MRRERQRGSGWSIRMLYNSQPLSNVFPISFSRNELLDIRNSTPENFLPTFEHSDVLLDILVGGAAFLYKRSKRRKQGKRAGALDFLNSAALCFTETWLNGTIPDSALHLTVFQLIRADRVTESSGKTRGAVFINCKPFYSPREVSSFILVSVYIPPDARTSAALVLLADQITHTEQRYPDTSILVLGDFNKAHLTRELPKYRQHITCPTRDSNILDHCYTVLKDAYHSVPRAALGLSDHCLVHLLPAYRQKLKSAKPIVKTVKRWTVEAERDLQACFELCDTVTSYISFCEDMCAKKEAYRSGDKVLYKQAKYTLNRKIRVAKLNYSGKLKKQLSRNDPKSVWNGLKAITSYKSPSPSTEANQQLADDLNEFYCRFEKQKTAINTLLLHPPTVSQPALKICEGDVCKVFRKQKIRKAKGPDGVSPACLKACAVQLSSIFTLIFNRSLELCIVPSCFKCSTIIPVPKKPKTTGLNDYRPVALTSVVIRSFERLVLAYLKDITGPLLDPLQFAYRANRSVDDAVNMGLHYILQHLDKPGTYARILFVDFSSAFNTIIPDILQNKLSQLSLPTDRQQLVRLGKLTSGTRTISTRAPQGSFADDTTVIGLIRDGDESAYRQEVKQLSLWCSHNNLELNTLKTVEMTVDFWRKPPALTPLTIMNSTVAAVDSFKFLGTNISQDLKWDIHIDSIVKKAQQRLYFLRQLKKFNLPQALMTQFYSSVIESVLCSSITVWFGAASKSDIRRLQRTVRTAERIIGVHLPNLQDLYTSRVKKRAGNIIQDPSHPGHNLFALLPSGRRYRSLSTKTSRHKNSFFPNAISSLNR
ncbi:putative RNA-directed DNA polymerase from transposon BS [Labeo rohita]|uniref:RNA-directed DNA polymerase from transposon BS n=1 Tax=Labeo rohita TaxID=84645 RepID=A0ABQ8LED0_LABRO|nr:putative RNA-directed DNA polymerase from transposon BS [Labeo rohita]